MNALARLLRPLVVLVVLVLVGPSPALAAKDPPTTNILLPLYVYPVAGAWDPVYAAIAANPTLQFQVVINPSSGPGVPAAQNGSDAIGYDDNWINATATVNSFANARTFGYVHLLNGQSPLDQVQANLSTWRAWGNASNIAGQRNASIHGVFFDETPDNMTAYMANVTQLAHATLDNDDDNTTSTINTIFNVGKAALDNAYFALADHVIVCEIAAENYSTSVPTANVPAEFASRAAILVYDFESYNQSSKSELRTWLRGMVQAGIGSANVVGKGWDQSALNASMSAPADVGTVATLLVEGKAGGRAGGVVVGVVVSAVVGIWLLLV